MIKSFSGFQQAIIRILFESNQKQRRMLFSEKPFMEHSLKNWAPCENQIYNQYSASIGC